MRAGLLRHRVTIESPPTTQDSHGQVTGAWVPFVSCWASISPLAGRELIAARSVESGVSHVVRIRYRSGITSGMRVNFDGRYFNIIAVRNLDERNRETVLDCEEGLTSD